MISSNAPGGRKLLSNTLEIDLFREQRAIRRNPKTPTEFSLHIFLLFAPFLAPGLKDINQNGPTTLPPHAHVRNLFFGQACRQAGRPFLLCGTSSSENASSIYHDRFPDFSRRDFSPDFVPSSASCHGGREKRREKNGAPPVRIEFLDLESPILFGGDWQIAPRMRCFIHEKYNQPRRRRGSHSTLEREEHILLLLGPGKKRWAKPAGGATQKAAIRLVPPIPHTPSHREGGKQP